MNRLKTLTIVMAILALAAPAAFGQFAATGTTTLSLTVGPEAAISVTEVSTPLSLSGGLFSDYTGTTNFTYKIRTSKDGGTGSITASVAEFGAGGPSLAAGDLKYTCSVSAPGNGCTTEMTAATAGTNVAGFGADARSTKDGNSGSVTWTLVNDPQYETGLHTSIVTFSISAL
jgi:hypothetical protein